MHYSSSLLVVVIMSLLTGSTCFMMGFPKKQLLKPNGIISRLRSRDALNGTPFTRDGIGLPKGTFNERLKYRLDREQLSGLPTKRPYLVLGIESSCDDTGVSVVSSDGRILSNVVYSQHQIHNKFGGVVPTLAMEAHKSNIDIAVERAIQEAGLSSIDDVDAIAATKGPGLEICLRIGLNKAQTLAKSFNKPFVTVHHHEAHCLLARLVGEQIQSMDTPLPTTKPSRASTSPLWNFKPKIDYPFLVFLASGGHTSILLCRGLGEYDFIGGTLDDALGEGFDKAARLMGLESETTGGPEIERLAQFYEDNADEIKARNSSIPFQHTMKVPMRDRLTCDFSYAGLKNSFRKEVLKFRSLLGLNDTVLNAPAQQMLETSDVVTLPKDIAAYLSYVYQDIAFSHVEDRLNVAFRYLDSRKLTSQLTGLVVVGGVAANMTLRRRLLQLLQKQKRHDHLQLIFPPMALCTDNGVMAAWAGIEKLEQFISNASEGHEPLPRWNIGTLLPDRPGYENNIPLSKRPAPQKPPPSSAAR